MKLGPNLTTKVHIAGLLLQNLHKQQVLNNMLILSKDLFKCENAFSITVQPTLERFHVAISHMPSSKKLEQAHFQPSPTKKTRDTSDQNLSLSLIEASLRLSAEVRWSMKKF